MDLLVSRHYEYQTFIQIPKAIAWLRKEMFARVSSTQMYNLWLGKSLSHNSVGTEEVLGQYHYPPVLFPSSFPKLTFQEGCGTVTDLV